VAEHEIDKLEIARETPSSLLLLGIMGTVVGMVVALTTFGTPGLQGDGAAINVGRILSSMFLAFISTGIALLLSVSIRSYLEKVSIQQSTMLSELDSYAFTQLAPYFLPKRDSAIQANLHELMKRQQENLSASLDNSMTTLNAFAEMIEQERTLLQQLTRSLAQEVSTAKGVGQRITVDLEKASGEVSNKLLDALQLVNKEIVGQRTALELSHRNHERLLEESHRLNSKQVEALQNHLIATIELLRENNLEIVKNMQTMTTHFSAHTEDQTTAIDALRQEVAQLSNRLLDAQERQQKNLLQSLQAFLLEQFKEMTRSIGFRRRT
jgi:hypothetical protein